MDGFHPGEAITTYQILSDPRRPISITSIEGDHISKAFARGQWYEEGMLEHIRSSVGAGSVFVDVGAHVGNHALFFALECEARSVWAFEPNPLLFQLLRANLEQNRIIIESLGGEGVIPVYGALYESTGKWAVSQAWDPGNSGSARVHIMPPGSLDPCSDEAFAPVWSIDAFFAVIQLDRLDVIKIDAEGMSLPILIGAMHTIRRFRPRIFVEVDSPAEAEQIRLALARVAEYIRVRRWNATPTIEFAVP